MSIFLKTINMYKKVILYIIFSLIYGGVFFAQEKKEEKKISGYIVNLKNDTLHCEFLNISNIFYKDLFNPAAACAKKIKVKFEAGEEQDFKPYELISFHVLFKKYDYNKIAGTQTNDNNLLDAKFVGLQGDNYKIFYREVVEGKISVYHKYFQDMRANLFAKEIFVKDDEIKDVSSLNFRDDFSVLIIDYPDLYKKWIDENKYYKRGEYPIVIMLYNEYFKNK